MTWYWFQMDHLIRDQLEVEADSMDEALDKVGVKFRRKHKLPDDAIITVSSADNSPLSPKELNRRLELALRILKEGK